MTDTRLADRALAAGLAQPDPTTCGSCSLVVARMLHDPAYAALVVEGRNLAPAERAGGSILQRFTDQALATHRRTNASRDSARSLQIPWPRKLGTQPWALAREMTNRAGAHDRTYRVRPVTPARRAETFARMTTLVAEGFAVPLYVGNRWAPRHVVLALPTGPTRSDSGARVGSGAGSDDGELRIYDPARGRRYPIGAAAFAAADLDVAGWSVPWAVVVPG